MSSLNPQQLIAAEHIDGPMLVLAGAGSGKTRVVIYRIANLLSRGVSASAILAVTFTNKAAAEMRHRILRSAAQSVLCCTFHSLCASILRESITPLGYPQGFAIYDEDDSEKLLKECLSSLGVGGDKGIFKSLRAKISRAKNALLGPEVFREEDSQLHEVYALYQQRLLSFGALDFDDLLFLTVSLFHKSPETLALYQNRWNFILIDEYQDTNAAQYGIIQLLSAQHKNVFAVGDPDQSIYSWRGANVHNILNFSQDFPGATIISLEQNYRSRSNILEAANALIQHNQGRYEKNLWSDRGEGEPITLFAGQDERDEARFVISQLVKLKQRGISLNDCAVFYRTNSQSRAFEDLLLREHLAYQVIGGLSFYHRREIKDVLALLRMILSGLDFLAFSRTLNIPKRGLGETLLDRLREETLARGMDVLSCSRDILAGEISFKLSSRQTEGLREYCTLIGDLRALHAQNLPIHEIILQAIERSRYLSHLKEDPESYLERKGNIEELVAKAAEWETEVDKPSLASFVEELALKSTQDEKAPAEESLRLMTVHNSKGLEFSAVFLVGMEEQLFPHANSFDNPEALEEERRLCYVGMTRAKEILFLSYSHQRFLWGTPRVMTPSRFLREIPAALLVRTQKDRADNDLARGRSHKF